VGAVLHRQLAVHARDFAAAALLVMLVDVEELLGHERRRLGGASLCCSTDLILLLLRQPVPDVRRSIHVPVGAVLLGHALDDVGPARLVWRPAVRVDEANELALVPAERRPVDIDLDAQNSPGCCHPDLAC